MAKVRTRNGIVTEDWNGEIIIGSQRLLLDDLIPYGSTHKTIRKIQDHLLKVENILQGYHNIRFQYYGGRVLADRPMTAEEKAAQVAYKKKHAKRLAAEKLKRAAEKAKREEKKKKAAERAKARRLKQFEKLKKEFARG